MRKLDVQRHCDKALPRHAINSFPCRRLGSDANVMIVVVADDDAQSVRAFARSCMNFSLGKGWDLFLSTKNTILKASRWMWSFWFSLTSEQ